MHGFFPLSPRTIKNGLFPASLLLVSQFLLAVGYGWVVGRTGSFGVEKKLLFPLSPSLNRNSRQWAFLLFLLLHQNSFRITTFTSIPHLSSSQGSDIRSKFRRYTIVRSSSSCSKYINVPFSLFQSLNSKKKYVSIVWSFGWRRRKDCLNSSSTCLYNKQPES